MHDPIAVLENLLKVKTPEDLDGYGYESKFRTSGYKIIHINDGNSDGEVDESDRNVLIFMAGETVDDFQNSSKSIKKLFDKTNDDCNIAFYFPKIKTFKDGFVYDHEKIHVVGSNTLRDAVYDCFGRKLTALILPECEEIGEKLFSSCRKLKYLILPKLKTLHEESFAGCVELSYICLQSAESIGTSAFSGCYNLLSVNLPEAQEIGNGAFNYCVNMETIDIPKIKTIRENAFYKTEKLCKIDISKVDKIEEGALAYSSLKTIACTGNSSYRVKRIEGGDNDALLEKDGDNWKLIHICGIDSKVIVNLSKFLEDERVTAIGEKSCIGINVPCLETRRLERIGAQAFRDSKLNVVKAPNLMEIGDCAFLNCSDLNYFYAPDIVSIGRYAFSYDESLTHFVLHHAQKLCEGAFYHCTHLRDAEFDELTEIPKNCFAYCRNLLTARFKGSNIRVIGDYAFYACDAFQCIGLQSETKDNDDIAETDPIQHGDGVHVPLLDGLKECEIGKDAFSGCYTRHEDKIKKRLDKIGVKQKTGIREQKAWLIAKSNLQSISPDHVRIPETMSCIYGSMRYWENVGIRYIFESDVSETLTVPRHCRICDSSFKNCENLLEVRVHFDFDYRCLGYIPFRQGYSVLVVMDSSEDEDQSQLHYLNKDQIRDYIQTNVDDGTLDDVLEEIWDSEHNINKIESYNGHIFVNVQMSYDGTLPLIRPGTYVIQTQRPESDPNGKALVSITDVATMPAEPGDDFE